MKDVVIVECTEYSPEVLRDKLSHLLTTYFPQIFRLAPRRVLLKPNLLMPIEPQKAVTTHPAIVQAVGTIFQSAGYEVSIADNSSAFCTTSSLEQVYEITGMKQVARRYGFKLITAHDIRVIDTIPYSSWIEGYHMINMPKVKTHTLTMLTCAAKNLYGCIKGLHKSYLHSVYPRGQDMANLLLQMYGQIKPRLNIADGIWSLAGDGPSLSGTATKTGFIALGDDTLAVDYAITQVLGGDYLKNPVLRIAEERGIFQKSSVNIIFAGKEIRIAHFLFPSGFSPDRIPQGLLRVIGRLWVRKPFIVQKSCKHCWKCVEICPQTAISNHTGKAVIDYSKCIMCFCCNEVCRFHAVGIRGSKLFDWMLVLKDISYKIIRGMRRKSITLRGDTRAFRNRGVR